MSDLRVDGRQLTVRADQLAQPLAETLREAGASAVKMPCGEGTCGGCTVQLDGAPVPSCLTATGRAVGREVRTAAATTASDSGARLATELARRGGLQCGFCVPGLVGSATALLDAGAELTEAAVRQALSGHLCRCTGYEGLVDAVLRAAQAVQGRTAARVDGAGKASGATRFAADHAPAGTLTGLLLTSRSAHARVSIGPGTALQVPGAVAVLGPQDAPPGRFSTNPHVEDPVLGPQENSVFAAEARYAGDIVGMVIAQSPHAAREMAELVEQVETPLPAVPTLQTALAPGAPPARTDDAVQLDGNVAATLALGADPEQVQRALAAAPHRFVHRAEILPGPVAAMERPAAVARWEADGGVRVWSTSQVPQVVRHRLAGLLDLPAAQVHVEAVALGGGFGLKEEVFLEPAAAVASRAAGGRAVRVELTRAQLGRARRRNNGTITITTGCADDGTMLARDVAVDMDAGGEVSHTALVLENLLLLAMSLYPVPVARAAGRVVLTNTANSGAFRGYGSAELGFALEAHLDELAHRFGTDPLDYRRRHVLRAGDTDPVNGWQVRSFASQACLDVLADALREPGPTSDARWRRGRGIALFAIVSAASSAHHKDTSGARCRIDDGGPVIGTVVPDMGQGLHSMLASVAGERFGFEVHLEQLPSADGPHDEGTFASRGVYMTGNAVADAVARLAAAVEQKLGWPPASLRWSPEGPVRQGETFPVPWGELTGIQVDGSSVGEDNGLVIGGQLAQVAVDTHTGRVLVERVLSVHDVGRVIDPASARGQVVGGVVQGIGVALTEQARHQDGVPLDVHLFDHAIPTMLTAPLIEDVYVGDGLARGALGAKGLGEAPMVGVPAAVANAIRDATGVRLLTMPMTPERVLTALQELGKVDRCD